MKIVEPEGSERPPRRESTREIETVTNTEEKPETKEEEKEEKKQKAEDVDDVPTDVLA